MRIRNCGRAFGILFLLCLFAGGCTDGIMAESPKDFSLNISEEPNPTASASAAGDRTAFEAEGAANRVSFLEEGGNFAFSSLDETEKIWYRDIERILGEYREEVKLSEEGLAAGLDENDLDRIFQCVLNDHPELFYVDGYSYTKYTRFGGTGEITAMEFSGKYNADPDTIRSRYDRIQEQVQRILAGIDADASEYDKVKYVYDTVIRETDYQLDAPDNQNIYSVFVNHSSVCQGYAKATQYLLHRLNVECALVLGTVHTGEGHAWNLVKIDGSYYYVDTTWGDASYQSEEEDGDLAAIPDINYDYLNVTTQELLRTHVPDDRLPLPVCTDTAANYYVREGALFTEYDREQMAALFDRALGQGRNDVTVKCADEACYEEIVSALIEDQEIFQYFDRHGDTVAYTQNPVQRSLTFWVTND